MIPPLIITPPQELPPDPIDVSAFVPQDFAERPYVHALILTEIQEGEVLDYHAEASSPLEALVSMQGTRGERVLQVCYYLFDAFHKGSYLGSPEAPTVLRFARLAAQARGGDAKAVEALGFEYFTSSTVPPPHLMGYRLLVNAAKRGSPHSQYFLALRHLSGDITLFESYKCALSYLLSAAKKGLPAAKEALVKHLNKKTGVIPETGFVIPYYSTRLGPDGKRKAERMLGEAHYLGNQGVLQNKAKGLSRLCKLAASGYAPGQTSLEKLVLSEGALQDESTERALRAACTARLVGAQYTLALYLEKKGIDPRSTEITTLKKSALVEGDQRATDERRSRPLRLGFR